MKTWLFRLFLVAVVAGLALAAWWYFFPSPERVLRKQMAELAQAVSFTSAEGPLAKIANSQRLASFFASDVEITVDVPGYRQQTFSGREAVLQGAMGARNTLDTLVAEFPGIKVLVSPDKQQATVSATASVKVSGGRDPMIQELRFQFRKYESRWYIQRVETVKVLN